MKVRSGDEKKGKSGPGEVEVIVVSGGREIRRICRPLHSDPGGATVVYRGRHWRLAGGMIHVDGDPVKTTADTSVREKKAKRAARGTTGTATGSGTRRATKRQTSPAKKKKTTRKTSTARRPVEISAPVQPSEAEGAATQQRIITRPDTDRVLVDAGPGTGKTHVACSRVAHLISTGVPAGSIWLITFTRTAVLEIRSRIEAALAAESLDPAEAFSVGISTLDSKAFALHSGFKTDVRLTGTFDEAIAATLQHLKDDPSVRDYLATSVRHLILDEAQDIVGVRADLVLGIIRILTGAQCGITVFADEAQAIYGFSEEEDETAAQSGPTLLDRLRSLGFEEASLTRVYRTSRPNLLTIATTVRQEVLQRFGAVEARREKLEEAIRSQADEEIGPMNGVSLADRPDIGLLLARRRYDFLMYSSMQQDVPHRLRLSGLPRCIHPWLGALFWDWTDERLGKQDLERLWQSRDVARLPGSPPDAAAAWQTLMEAAGKTERLIDMHRLRKLLGTPNPPMIFCAPEFGYQGPILGTIHASKGREADHVALFLPQNGDQNKNSDPEEEIRVLFVGATRARRTFVVGEAWERGAASLNGRVWREVSKSPHGQRRVQVEIGCEGDLTAEGLVGRRTFQTEDEARIAQERWQMTPVLTNLVARSGGSALDWNLVLENSQRNRLALLSPSLTADLRGIAKIAGFWPPPDYFGHLRSLGARTLVLAPGDSRLDTLHAPWRASGFVLAPLLLGFSSCVLKSR